MGILAGRLECLDLPRQGGALSAIDGGEFYAHMKAPTRVRDMGSTGEIRYRWLETGTLDHYRHAHALDHLLSRQFPYTTDVGMVAGRLECLDLLR